MIEYELRTDEWLRVLGLENTIYDWDGFRDVSREYIMNHAEFQRRYNECTINVKDFWARASRPLPAR